MAEQISDKTIKELVRLGIIQGDAKEVGGVPFTVVPNDCQVIDLSKYKFNDFAPTPHRKKANVAVLDAAGFVEYYTKFCDENSRVFADETRASVLGIIDYHGAGPEGSPRWCQHRVQLGLRKSPQWITWTGKNGNPHRMGQSDFAEFIEDNSPDFKTPNAATMLEMARTLEAKVEVEFGSAIRTSNGQVQLTYNEQVKGVFGSGKIEIPEQFTICVPVFLSTAPLEVVARLRYRVNGGKVTFWYDLLRADHHERDAFLKSLTVIQEKLGVTIINGVPA